MSESNGAPTILAVDDDPAILELVRLVLSGAGYHVLVADSAREALKVFDTAPSAVQLLLTDVVMPDLTGPVLASRLRTRRPDLKLLFISGFHDTELVQHFASMKGIALLPKPFTTDGLLRAVESIVGRAVARPA